MKKPLIGISCNYDYADVFEQTNDIAALNPKWHFVSDCYTCAIENAGGIPLLLPIYSRKSDLENVLDVLDGVMITGGNDINPLEYGEVDRGKCGRIIPERDRQDIDIVRYTIHAAKPLLCICRGAQIMNVALGGSLYQDLETDGLYFRHMKSNYPMNAATHCVSIEQDSALFGIFKRDSVGVNSFHHQGIKNAGENLRAVARSEDGVIEAIEWIGKSFALGIQWHPEKMYDSDEQRKLFAAFVEKAGRITG